MAYFDTPRLLLPAQCKVDLPAAREMLQEVANVRQHQHAACDARVGDPITRPRVFINHVLKQVAAYGQ